MDVNQLRDWVEEPETHRRIVGDYNGSYALGVTENPPALLLRVESKDISAFPTTVKLHDQEVPVQVEGNFTQPQPLSSRVRPT